MRESSRAPCRLPLSTSAIVIEQIQREDRHILNAFIRALFWLILSFSACRSLRRDSRIFLFGDAADFVTLATAFRPSDDSGTLGCGSTCAAILS